MNYDRLPPRQELVAKLKQAEKMAKLAEQKATRAKQLHALAGRLERHAELLRRRIEERTDALEVLKFAARVPGWERTHRGEVAEAKLVARSARAAGKAKCPHVDRWLALRGDERTAYLLANAESIVQELETTN